MRSVEGPRRYGRRLRGGGGFWKWERTWWGGGELGVLTMGREGLFKSVFIYFGAFVWLVGAGVLLDGRF